MRSRPAIALCAWLLIVCGATIRLIHLLANRSLYIDEARLALNVGTRTYTGLLRPLALEQVAPIPFLLIEKAVTHLLGMGEVALRFVPFLCGVALLPVAWALARRVLTPGFALLALALTAVSPALVRESNNFKQYSWDALIAGLILLLTARAICEPKSRHIILLVLAAPLASAASLTAMFVVMPSLVVTGVTAFRRNERRQAVLCTISCTLSLGIALGLYAVVYAPSASGEYMQGFWSGSFISLPSAYSSSHNTMIAADGVWNLVNGAVPAGRSALLMGALVHTLTIGIVAFAVIGVAALWRSRSWLGLAITGPLILVICANLARVYPLRARLEVFVMMPFALLVVAGFEWLRLRTDRRIVAVGVAPLLALASAKVAFPSLWPYQWEELRPIVSHIVARPGKAPIYVYANAAPAWLFYTTTWAAPDTQRLSKVMALIGYGGPAFENAFSLPNTGADVEPTTIWGGRTEYYGRSTGLPWRPYIDRTAQRVHLDWLLSERRRIVANAEPSTWLIFAHYRGTENELLDSLESRGFSQRAQVRARGAAAFLYERGAAE